MLHKNSFASFLFVTAMTLAAGACTGDGNGGGDGDGDGSVTGAARYTDSDTDANGAPHQPAAPAPQQADLSFTVEGNAVLPTLEPTCLDGLAGKFEALYDGELAIGDNGAYAAGFGSAVTSLTTPSGCTLPSLEVTAITKITARAAITAT